MGKIAVGITLCSWKVLTQSEFGMKHLITFIEYSKKLNIPINFEQIQLLCDLAIKFAATDFDRDRVIDFVGKFIQQKCAITFTHIEKLLALILSEIHALSTIEKFATCFWTTKNHQVQYSTLLFTQKTFDLICDHPEKLNDWKRLIEIHDKHRKKMYSPDSMVGMVQTNVTFSLCMLADPSSILLLYDLGKFGSRCFQDILQFHASLAIYHEIIDATLIIDSSAKKHAAVVALDYLRNMLRSPLLGSYYTSLMVNGRTYSIQKELEDNGLPAAVCEIITGYENFNPLSIKAFFDKLCKLEAIPIEFLLADKTLVLDSQPLDEILSETIVKLKAAKSAKDKTLSQTSASLFAPKIPDKDNHGSAAAPPFRPH